MGTSQQAGAGARGALSSPLFPASPSIRPSPSSSSSHPLLPLVFPGPRPPPSPQVLLASASPSPFHPFSLFVSWSPLNSPPQNPQGFLQTQSGDKPSLLVVGGVGAGLSCRAGAGGPQGLQTGGDPSLTWSLSPLPTLAGAVVTRGEAKTQVSVGPRPGWTPGWGGAGWVVRLEPGGRKPSVQAGWGPGHPGNRHPQGWGPGAPREDTAFGSVGDALAPNPEGKWPLRGSWTCHGTF